MYFSQKHVHTSYLCKYLRLNETNVSSVNCLCPQMLCGFQFSSLGSDIIIHAVRHLFHENKNRSRHLCFFAVVLSCPLLSVTLLKGTVTRFFASGSFHESVSPQPQSIPLRPFRIFSTIRGDIRRSRFATGVNDTGGKWKKSSIRKILII